MVLKELIIGEMNNVFSSVFLSKLVYEYSSKSVY
jgi:hypothetical protein